MQTGKQRQRAFHYPWLSLDIHRLPWVPIARERGETGVKGTVVYAMATVARLVQEDDGPGLEGSFFSVDCNNAV